MPDMYVAMHVDMYVDMYVDMCPDESTAVSSFSTA